MRVEDLVEVFLYIYIGPELKEEEHIYFFSFLINLVNHTIITTCKIMLPVEIFFVGV